MTTTCPECGATVPVGDAPRHAYVPGAPGCWHLFTLVQAEAMARLGPGALHGTAADAYLSQHPGDGTGDPRALRSPIIHLIGLCARLEHGLDDLAVARLMGGADPGLRLREEPALAPRAERGALTVGDLAAALDDAPERFADLTRRWAQEVWRTWSHEHDRVRALYSRAWPRR